MLLDLMIKGFNLLHKLTVSFFQLVSKLLVLIQFRLIISFRFFKLSTFLSQFCAIFTQFFVCFLDLLQESVSFPTVGFELLYPLYHCFSVHFSESGFGFSQFLLMVLELMRLVFELQF